MCAVKTTKLWPALLCWMGASALAQTMEMGGGGAYEWRMADVQTDGFFECPQRFSYLVLEQLSMNDAGAVHYRVRGEGGERSGVLSPTQPKPHERRVAAALRGAANQPLQQPVGIVCVRAEAEDPWFTFGTRTPYAWKKADMGAKPCGDGKDGLRHPLVIQLLNVEGHGVLRYAVQGAAQSTSGVMDPENPAHSQVRLSQLLVAHAGQEVPREGIAVCVNAHEDDPLIVPTAAQSEGAHRP